MTAEVEALVVDRSNPDQIIMALMQPNLPEPHQLYRVLRETAPSHRSALGLRFLSTHAGCVELLRSKDFTQSFGLVEPERMAASPFFRSVTEMIILTDPPDHSRLRKLVAKAFTPRMVETLRPGLEERVGELLDGLAGRDEVDVVAEFAEPIPSLTLCQLIGAPFEEYRQIDEWSDAIQNALTPIIADDVLARADAAVVEFHSYIRELVAARRREPRDDLVSALAAAEADGDRLTESELVNMVFTMLAAGAETTMATISSGVLLIGTHDSERAKLLADPGLVGNAVDEIVRYDAPVQNSFLRVAQRATEVAGVQIDAGEAVVALIAAANRDPAAFTDADEFRIDRTDARDNLAFGTGIHNCIGKALGVTQARVALGALFARFPELRVLDERPVWRKTMPNKRLDRLRVTLGKEAT
jgi:hypothetical protein